jgi:hypothetical protein
LSAPRLPQDAAGEPAIEIRVWIGAATRRLGPLDSASRRADVPSLQTSLYVVPSLQARAPSGVALVAAGLTVTGEEVPFLDPERDPAAAGPSPRRAHDAGQRNAESDWAADPILGQKQPFRFQPEFAERNGGLRFQLLNEVLPRIARAYRMNLVADAYRQRRLFPLPPPSEEERSAGEVLDQYVSPGAEWNRKAAFIHVRRHGWYDDRVAEIPERVVKYWSEYLQQRRQFSLEDVATLVRTLRNPQMEVFEAVMREHGIRFSAPGGTDYAFFRRNVIENQEILRAYASLSTGQQLLLQQGRALPFAAMPPRAQGALLSAAIRQNRLSADPTDLHRMMGRMTAPLPDQALPRSLTLSVVSNPRQAATGDKNERYDFHLHYGDAARSPLFCLYLPRIELDRAACTSHASSLA